MGHHRAIRVHFKFNMKQNTMADSEILKCMDKTYFYDTTLKQPHNYLIIKYYCIAEH